MPSRKGRPNKKTQEYRDKIRAYAANKHYDPIYAMIRMAISKDPEITHELRFRCHETVAQYFVSKLKPIDPDTGSAEDRIRLRVLLGGSDD